MLARRDGRAFECVVVDLNTQRDFCDARGAHPVANLGDLYGNLRRAVAWAKRNQAPVISSVESHRLWEVPANGSNILCCLEGSSGQKKLDFTLFPSRECADADNTLAVPVDFFRDFQQVIFRKRTDDLLANPKADRFLTQLAVEEFVVFGIGIESSVKALALALLTRSRPVTVVVDACGYWDSGAADLALRQIAAKGAKLITIDSLAGRKLDRSVRYAHVRNGRNGHNGHNGNGNGHHNGAHRPGRLSNGLPDLMEFRALNRMPERP